MEKFIEKNAFAIAIVCVMTALLTGASLVIYMYVTFYTK